MTYSGHIKNGQIALAIQLASAMELRGVHSKPQVTLAASDAELNAAAAMEGISVLDPSQP